MENTTSHPKGLYLLFATEMAERFSYYGMRALLVLYMVNALKFTEEQSSLFYGNYTGLVYLTPLIGGIISDKLWGNRRSIFTGAVAMAIGQFSLAASAFMAGSGLATAIFWFGLLMLILGNGLFKPNISTLVGQLYAKDDKRVDSAFSIFYMGINLGAFFSPLICGYLGQKIGFGWGFLAAGIGMVISLVLFETLKDKYLVTPDGKPIGGKPNHEEQEQETFADKAIDEMISEIGVDENEVPVAPSKAPSIEAPKAVANSPQRIGIWLAVYAALWGIFMFGAGFNFVSTLIFATSLASGGYIITDPTLSKMERDRIMVVYIIAFFVIFFWSAFEQAGASLTIFADKCVNLNIMGWDMPSSYFQSVNPLGIIILAPIFAILWQSLGKRNMEPSSPIKQAIGMFLLALGYLVIAFGVRGVACEDKTPMLWLMAMYVIHTVGELCLSPIGLSMVVRLAPVRLASLLMGVWFMSNAMANDFAGMLSALIPKDGAPAKFFLGYQIANLYDFFMLFVFMSAISAIILFLMSRKLLQMMHGIR